MSVSDKSKKGNVWFMAMVLVLFDNQLMLVQIF